MPTPLAQLLRRRALQLRVLLWLLLLALLAGVLLASFAGALPVDWRNLGDPQADGWAVLLELRWPRLLAALVVGGALALSGAVLQVLLRNPVADAGLLGITPAAALAAVCWLALGVELWPGLTLPLAALAGGTAMSLLLLLASVGPSGAGGERLLLIGVAAGALCSGLMALLLYSLDDLALRQMHFWLLGSVAHTSLQAAACGGLLLLLACGWLWRHSAAIDALLLGEVEARLAGIGVDQLRHRLLLLAAMLAALAVVLAGGVAFVGLLVPHLLRRLGCERHRQLLPLSLLGGAVLLLWADQGIRLLVAVPLPLGVITMILGAPALLLLLWRRGALR